ncbi:hypothetical protein WMY93_011283 [Mugilogobius chulae]|uniref:DDE Tnp4 domain-containing protein n=1 Tax=Mugilogobius chulae TaxID=88201 RepID=A0AAW0P1J4_9GOBI
MSSFHKSDSTYSEFQSSSELESRNDVISKVNVGERIPVGKSENMDAQKTRAACAAFSYYRLFICQYEHHLKSIWEEDEARRRQPVIKTGTQWRLMLSMKDDTFSRHFRITKTQFEYLLFKTEESLHKEYTHGGYEPLPGSQKLLIFLWYLANQNCFREISDKFNVSQSSAHRVIMEVLEQICTLGNCFISWPNACEKNASATAFERVCGLPGIIGAIDGCHIRIQRPPVRGGDYMNRKAFYSILLQAIVDERGRFIDLFVGPPGRQVHDARMLRASTFYANWQEKMGEYTLLGDSAYIGQAFPFIEAPKRDNGALTGADNQRNACISRGRVVVEQAFGRLKCKWRRLRDLQNTRLDASDVCQEHPHGCPREEDDNE